MPVKRDPSGRRSVEAQVEVPGTPEEVWQAIATGHGISSWFVPSTSDERVGGQAICNFGPGMESIATIKTWEPPHRFVAETEEGHGPVATEWIVEARDGGTCIVRVVHSWFAETDDWDDEFEGHTYGWQSFFRILRLYLTHFAGQGSASFQVLGFGEEPAPKAWESLISALGLERAAEEARVETASGAPTMGGTVARLGQPSEPELLLRLDQPTSGIAHLFAMAMGGQVLLSIRLYLYGDQASATAKEAEPQWQEWINKHFPAG